MSAMIATHDMIADQEDRSRELLRDAAYDAVGDVRLRGLDSSEAHNIVRQAADDYLSEHAARLSWDDPTDADTAAVYSRAYDALQDAIEAEREAASGVD